MVTRRPASVPSSAADPPVALQRMTGFLVNQLAERLRDSTARALEDLGLRPRHLGLLIVLRDEGALGQLQLGVRVGMDRTTVMQHAHELEAAGLVKRSPHPDDARSQRVALTRRGRTLATRAESRAHAVADGILEPLTSRERAVFHKLLLKLLP